MRQVSDYELGLMKTIWGDGNRALYVEIVEELEARGEPRMKNMVITLLSRLMEKGLLKSNKIRWRNEYMAAVMEEDYQTAQTGTFFRKPYQEDTRRPVYALIKREMLSPENYEELRQFQESRGVDHD